MEYSQLGLLIKANRKLQKLNQNIICTDTISRKTLYNIEHGKPATEETYVCILKKLSLGNLDRYDVESINSHINDAYVYLSNFQINDAIEAFKEIIVFNYSNCFFKETKRAINALLSFYTNRNLLTEAEINYFIEILDIFPYKLQCMILDVSCTSNRFNKRSNNSSLKKALESHNDHLVNFNKIMYSLQKKNLLDAYELVNSEMAQCLKENLFNRYIKMYQIRLQIHFVTSDAAFEREGTNLLTFVKENESQISNDIICSVFTQLGGCYVIRKQYTEALSLLKLGKTYFQQNLISNILENYCYDQLGIEEFSVYAINESDDYVHVKFYKYLYKKHIHQEDSSLLKTLVIDSKKLDYLLIKQLILREKFHLKKTK